jgi:TPR repeat protein
VHQALAQNPNHLRAMFNLGRANERAARLNEAARLYKLAADQGYAPAQLDLGASYADGSRGLAKDEREAARLVKLAADQGLAAAQFILGGFYSKGLGGLAKDEREAVRLFRLAADQGSPRAGHPCPLSPEWRRRVGEGRA